MELVSGNDDVHVNNPGVKLTYDDFVLFPHDGKRHELIDGEHYVTPSREREGRSRAGHRDRVKRDSKARRDNQAPTLRAFERIGILGRRS